MANVWYAAFGSNLLYSRFSTYLEGGDPGLSPRSIREVGARDPSPPTGFDDLVVAHRLYFAHSSPKWNGGGVAFLDSERNETEATMCRLYRLTLEQLADVQAQEARQDSPAFINIDDVIARGHIDYSTGLYGRLLFLGHHESGEPVFTITTGRADLERNNPDPSYLRTIARGLKEAFALTNAEVVDYLSRTEGVNLASDHELWADIVT